MPYRLPALASLLLLASPAAAQDYPPAVTYESMMSLRYYPATGGILVDGLWLVFPPPGGASAEFIVRRPGGGVVATMPLRIRPTDNTAFARLVSSGPPLMVSESGDFVMAVRINQQEVTALPYTVRVQAGSDPFNPGKTYYRDGDWNRVGYLSVRSDDDNKLVSVNLWTSLQEFPGSSGQRQVVTVHLKRGGQEIAGGQSVVDWVNWQPIRVDLRESRANGPFFRLASLSDGAYSVEYRAHGRTVRSFPFRVQGGQITRPARNQLGSTPAHLFVSPRIMGRVGGDDVMQEIYWLETGP